MPPLQRPETDYERWLRENDQDFELGDTPLYDAYQENALGPSDMGMTEEKPIVQSAYGASYGHFITRPDRSYEPATSSHRELGKWPGSYSNKWVVVGGMVVALLMVVVMRARKAPHVCRHKDCKDRKERERRVEVYWNWRRYQGET
ncbi:hypothetical protein BJX99DRAFT_262525 [Aspergillus californicus]